MKKNAINMMRNLFGKTAVQLNGGNICLKNSALALGITNLEEVAENEFIGLVKKYVEKSREKPVVQDEWQDWTFESLDDTWQGKKTSKVLKKGTIAQAKEYIEMLGKTEEFLAFVNR